MDQKKMAQMDVAAGSQSITLSQQDETFSMKEMVSMAMEILESDTEYKPALAASIRAFHSAVTMENDMNHVQEELKGMKERMERIKQMLLSLRATLPQERDKAANP